MNWHSEDNMEVWYGLHMKIANAHLSIITETLLLENQFGHGKGRSCSINSLSVNHIIVNRSVYNQETHIVFIDVEMAFDRINRWKLINIR